MYEIALLMIGAGGGVILLVLAVGIADMVGRTASEYRLLDEVAKLPEDNDASR